MPLTQTDRLLEVSAPIGANAFLLTAFAGREELSRPFAFRLELVSDADVKPAALVGHPIGWTVHFPEAKPRHFHGIVRSLAVGPSIGRGLRTYTAEVVPWLWLLSQTADCRVYQNKTVPEIVADVFQRFGFTDHSAKLTGTYKPREYCVQYRETALAFVSRLLEEEGIFYSFRFEQKKHTLVLADDVSAYAACDPHGTVEYRPELADVDVVTAWDRTFQFVPGKAATTDYNFETPAASLFGTTSSVVKVNGNAAMEVFEFPGKHAIAADGTAITRHWSEATEAEYDRAAGASRCSSFRAGGKFKLTNHPLDDGQSFALVAVDHSATEPAVPGVSAGRGEYGNTFVAIPAATVFRPLRGTPKPVAVGPQSAVVVGPKGEEIYTDKYGRVKVQFPWDRVGKTDENSSCWVRITESWAGKNWGTLFLPRIGQEVIVEFLNGDPDRPLVTGRVYNATHMPPFALPGEKTRSGLRTRSTTGGDTATFNELRFEDKKDAEDIYFHAQKDFHRVVENDDDLKVGHDQTIEVKHARTLTVKEGDETITIEKGNRTRTVKTGNDALTVSKGNHTVTVELGNDALTVKTGSHTVKVNAGASSTEAMQSITLKCGPSEIALTPSGITIKGLTVKVEGTTMASVKAIKTDVGGDAMLTLKGGITMIN